MTRDLKKEMLEKTFDLDVDMLRDKTIYEVIEYLQEFKNKIPLNAELKINPFTGEDPDLFFSWVVEETDEEFQLRNKNLADQLKRNAEYYEKQKQDSLKKLEMIQKKMGNY